MKKTISLLLVLAIVFSLMAGMGISSNAATQVELIINRAAYLAANNPHAYDGQCLSFCADCYKVAGYTGVSMGTAYKAGTAWIQSTSSSNIPVGALVFFDLTWHATAGHVGIYAGNGKMYDAESQYGGIKLRNFTTKGYRGWGWYNRIAPTGANGGEITAPRYAYISTDKLNYAVDETVTFNFNTDISSNTNTLWVYCPNGETLYYKNLGTSTTLAFGMAGYFEGLVEAWNGIGSCKSSRISWYVGKPQYAYISTSKSNYNVGENVVFSFNTAARADYNTLWIYYPDGTSKNYQNCGSSKTLTFTKTGTYQALVEAWNDIGSCVSSKVSFSITNKDCTHSYSSKVTTAATCTTTGVKTFTCSKCGNQYTQLIAALGHSYSGSVTKAATCTATGIKTFTCSKCGNQYTQSIAALGHSYSGSVTKAATCTEKGLKTFKCSRCSSSYTQDIAALGHNWVQSKTPARVSNTDSLDGFITTSCTRCAESYEEDISCVEYIYLSAVNYAYTGKTITPSVSVIDFDGKVLKKGTDYTVKYASGRKNVGKYAVKVSFQGKYTGSRMLHFKIVPKGTTLSKLTAGKKSFTAKWKKLGGITGYQIQYSTNTKFTSAKLVTIRSANTLSKTIKSLSAKKNYYVRVRTYKTVSGTHYMSAWSKTYKVKTK